MVWSGVMDRWLEVDGRRKFGEVRWLVRVWSVKLWGNWRWGFLLRGSIWFLIGGFERRSVFRVR